MTELFQQSRDENYQERSWCCGRQFQVPCRVRHQQTRFLQKDCVGRKSLFRRQDGIRFGGNESIHYLQR